MGAISLLSLSEKNSFKLIGSLIVFKTLNVPSFNVYRLFCVKSKRAPENS